jgi:hypothetical protein
LDDPTQGQGRPGEIAKGTTMNQHPLSGGALPNCLDGADLFGQALERPARLGSDDFENDAPSASDASLMSADRPRLSLVRAEDHDDRCEDSETDSILTEPSNQVPIELAAPCRLELWGETIELESDHCSDIRVADSALDARLPPLTESFELDDLPSLKSEQIGSPSPSAASESSESECITISNPLAEMPKPETAVAKASAASLTCTAPPRIGSGRLSTAKLTWKPGDPFGGSKEPRSGRFRWEVMLTTACVTALCGLACIWMLRAILA